MADFSSRFAVAISASDETKAGADKASRTLGDALAKPAGAAKLTGSKAADAFQTGINRPLDLAKRKTGEVDLSIRNLKDRLASRWHTGGMGKAFDSVGATQMATSSFANDIGSAFSPAEDLAALLAGGSLFTAVSKFDSSANELSRTAARFDISTDALQRWRGAVRLGGLDAGAATQSIDTLSRIMGAANHHLPEAKEAMQAASGIEVRTGIKLNFAGDFEHFLRDLNRAFQHLDAPTQRRAAQAFGVTAMLDELKKSPAQLEKDLADAAKHRNLTPEQIKSGDEGNRSIVAATDSTIGFAQAVAANLSPAFTPIFNGYSHWLDELKQSPRVLDAVGAGAVLLSTVLTGKLFKSVSSLTSAVSNFSSTWKDSPLGKGAAPGGGMVPGGAPEAAPTPKGAPGAKANFKPLSDMSPRTDWGLGLGLAYGKSLQDRQQWDRDFGAAKKKYADDVKALHAWIVQYNHDHPFVAPYGPGTADALAPLTKESGASHRFEPMTPKTMAPRSDVAPSSVRKLAQSSALAFAPSNAYAPLADLVGRGEGGYNSVNRGAPGDYKSGTENLATMTVDQVMAAQRAGKFNAAGKYQITKNTLPGAVEDLQLTGREKFDKALQDRIFAQYLIGDKRPQIRDYLAGRSDDLHGAALAASEEWASIADPDTGRTRYPGHNRASISPAEIEDALESARTQRQVRQGGVDRLRAPLDTEDAQQPRRHPTVEPAELPPDLAAYQPGQGDSSHEVMVRFVDAPRGMRADLSRAKGPAKIGVRIEHSMPV
jgi:hypothetical protein